MSETIRTVCHGCRQVTQYRDDSGVVRPMALPGNGTVWVDRAPGGLVEQPCPDCGGSGADGHADGGTDGGVDGSADGGVNGGGDDDPGWLPGFVPPV